LHSGEIIKGWAQHKTTYLVKEPLATAIRSVRLGAVEKEGELQSCKRILPAAAGET